MSVDDVILYTGTFQELKKMHKGNLVDGDMRLEKIYCGNYDSALRKFKEYLCSIGASAAYYFHHSVMGDRIHCFRGYPARMRRNKMHGDKRQK